MDMIMRGNEYRTISPTEANATSSRSHAVLQINISQKDRNADIHEPHMMATLSIIDLAGSERASATKNRGDRLLEGANINKSLLALGSCINALCDPRKKNHVPYRNSKLTRLLKFSLGGNCKTVMIVCVSPSSEHFDETQNTLRYANRAKNIQTKVTRNVYNVNRHVKDFLKKIDEQMALINELQAQQKDYEGVAFLKFKKVSEKREAMAREGIARIRTAYENATSERQEKAGNLKKLRQIERRITMISAWVAAFDGVCDNRGYEEPHKNLIAMRKSAQGILVELEGSRQHYHQKIAKSNWERAIDSALQSGVRQLKEVDGATDGSDVASLTREAELLKANAEREMLAGIVEQEKASDAAIAQVLLAAHFETIASIKMMLEMAEEEAVEAAKTILIKIMNACSDATSQVIKPGGELLSNDSHPNPSYGGPKRRKGAASLSASPMKPLVAPYLTNAAHLMPSPTKLSPKRRKVASAKKGISFTPKKKSPVKRGVRWRDDTENGTLAEFEKTPQRPDATPPEASSEEPILPPPVPAYLSNSATRGSDPDDSSPIPPPPEPSIDIRPKNNRFKTGFLRKTNGSPLPPKLTRLSSDSENSPLRELEPSKAINRSSLQFRESASSDVTPNDSGSNSAGSDSEWRAEASDAIKIKSAMKRTSAGTGIAGGRAHRRRSPTATSASSPPSEGALFTASHARRMVKSEKENSAITGVLSPRTAPITKPVRRTTIGEGRAASGLTVRDPVRLSAIVGSGGKIRESSGVMGAKGVWK
jgi:kinesin family member 18/19